MEHDLRKLSKQLVDVDAYTVEYAFADGFTSRDKKRVKSAIDPLGDLDPLGSSVEDGTLEVNSWGGGSGRVSRSPNPSDSGLPYEYEAHVVGEIHLADDGSVTRTNPGYLTAEVHVSIA